MKIVRLLLVLFCGVLGSSSQAQELYDLERIPEIRVTFAESNWAQILSDLKDDGKKERLKGDVSIDGKVFKGVGIRYKGNSSFNNSRNKGYKKLPFNIKANFTDSELTFPGGYKTLKLSNVFMDPSFVREALSYEIAREYMPAPKCNFAKVYVNDEYLGLYNNSESIDEKFLKHHFGKGSRMFVKCDPEWKEAQKEGCPEGDGKASLMYLGKNPECYKGLYEMKTGGKKSWNRLIHLTRIINHFPDSIDYYLNADAALWMHAFNNVLVNLDSYTGRLSHNYYLYRTPDGLLTPLVWDMNLSFGGFRLDGITPKMLSNTELQRISPFIHYKTKNENRPLIVKVMTNPLYRKLYVGRMKVILDDYFTNGKYLERAEAIQAIIDQEVMNDTGKLYDYASFQKNLNKTVPAGRASIIGVTELMKKRTEYLSGHPLMAIPPPIVSDVNENVIGEKVAISAKVVGAARAYLMYRKSKKKPFEQLELFDEGSTNDEMAEDGIYGNTIEYEAGTEYYIIAEGQRMAITSPKKAAFEFYTIK